MEPVVIQVHIQVKKATAKTQTAFISLL